MCDHISSKKNNMGAHEKIEVVVDNVECSRHCVHQSTTSLAGWQDGRGEPNESQKSGNSVAILGFGTPLTLFDSTD